MSAMNAILKYLRRVPPLAGVIFGLLVTTAWIGFLGYGLSKLGVLPF